MKKKINKKYGIVFWITGLSGSGKTSIGNKIAKEINKSYGKTIIIHGDDIRNIYNFKIYKPEERLKLGKNNSNLCRLISNQGINVIFTTVGLFHELQDYNRENIKNYVEVFVKSNIKNLLKRKTKKFYQKKTKFVWGLDIKPEFPKKPDIILQNNFQTSTKKLSETLMKKINKTIKLTI